ncbi:hypothetical protein [Sphingopyxis fribergensis]|nr:hypothetical protein [Sphingopyxis fribergensis]
MRHPSFIVIPAKAGISPVRMKAEGETPAFAGVTKKVETAKSRDTLEIFA